MHRIPLHRKIWMPTSAHSDVEMEVSRDFMHCPVRHYSDQGPLLPLLCPKICTPLNPQQTTNSAEQLEEIQPLILWWEFEPMTLMEGNSIYMHAFASYEAKTVNVACLCVRGTFGFDF